MSEIVLIETLIQLWIKCLDPINLITNEIINGKVKANDKPVVLDIMHAYKDLISQFISFTHDLNKFFEEKKLILEKYARVLLCDGITLSSILETLRIDLSNDSNLELVQKKAKDISKRMSNIMRDLSSYSKFKFESQLVDPHSVVFPSLEINDNEIINMTRERLLELIQVFGTNVKDFKNEINFLDKKISELSNSNIIKKSFN